MLSGAERLQVDGFDAFDLDGALARLDREDFVARVFRHDPGLWKAGDPAHASVVANRLGWLDVADTMAARTADLASFADGVRADRVGHVVLMGMGGSSLCPTVLRETFGVREGYPELIVLDSTSPAAIEHVERTVDAGATLFIEASKSGTTLESRCFAEYFFAKATAALGSERAAARNFACITDPGTPLEASGRERGYRRVFSNPPDIGGRYSALSYFGLVPGAAAGVDIQALLERARAMSTWCGADVPASRNPAARLGAALAQAALRGGRDKVTFFASPAIGAVGMWLEQLIAESTGKEGKGLVPIADEPAGDLDRYGNDRVFVFLACGAEEPHWPLRDAALTAGHPVVTIRLADSADLGAEFWRWEFATATAGALLAIDPFDEPNVKESKDNTNRILGEGVRAPGGAISPTDTGALASLVDGVRAGDYIALQAFVDPTPSRERILQRARAALRDRTRAATTLGFGPRFLHSTGQLHKGGPNTGNFIQLVGREGAALPIPGQPFDFGTLIAAQALGDLQSLRDHGRRVVCVDLGDDIDGGLSAFTDTIVS